MAIALSSNGSTLGFASSYFASPIAVNSVGSVIVLAIALYHGNFQTVSSVELNGVGPMTFKDSASVGGSVRVEYWYYVNPPVAGAHVAILALTGRVNSRTSWGVFTGIDLGEIASGPITKSATPAPVGSQPSLSVPTDGATDLVVDMLVVQRLDFLVQGAGQTLINTGQSPTGRAGPAQAVTSGMSHEAGTGSPVVMSWTGVDLGETTGVVHMAVVLKEPGAGGGPTEIEKTFALLYEALGGGVTQSFDLHHESIRPISQLYALEYEALQGGIVQTFALLYESRVSVTQTFALLEESLQNVEQTFPMLHEAAGAGELIQQIFTLNHEALQGGIVQTFALLHEALQALTQSFALRYEWLAPAGRAYALLYESLQAVEQTFALLHEATAEAGVIIWLPYGPGAEGYEFAIDGSKHIGMVYSVGYIIHTTDAQITANARLYNVTDDVPVPNTQIATLSTTPKNVNSITEGLGVIVLPLARKVYRFEQGRVAGPIATIEMAVFEGVL